MALWDFLKKCHYSSGKKTKEKSYQEDKDVQKTPTETKPTPVVQKERYAEEKVELKPEVRKELKQERKKSLSQNLNQNQSLKKSFQNIITTL